MPAPLALIPLLVHWLIPAALAAEPERATARWTAQVDPLTFALGYAHVQIERALSPRWSLYAGPHARLFDAPFSSVHEPYRGVGLELGLRRYLWGSAPEGAWVLTRGVGAVVTTMEPARETAPGGYFSLLAGYTGILGPGFVLSGGAGVQLIHYSVADYGVEGVFPALHTALGWAW